MLTWEARFIRVQAAGAMTVATDRWRRSCTIVVVGCACVVLWAAAIFMTDVRRINSLQATETPTEVVIIGRNCAALLKALDFPHPPGSAACRWPRRKLVRRRTMLGPPRLNKRLCRATVKKITVQPGKEYPSIRIDLELHAPAGQARKPLAVDFISLDPKAGWRVEQFLWACGLEPGRGFTKTALGPRRNRIEFDTENVEGLDCMVLLSVGQGKAKIANFHVKQYWRL